jgi:hypothetical protein
MLTKGAGFFLPAKSNMYSNGGLIGAGWYLSGCTPSTLCKPATTGSSSSQGGKGDHHTHISACSFFFFIFPWGRWRKFNPVADKFASCAVDMAVCISQMDKNRRGQKKTNIRGWGVSPGKTILVSIKKIFTIEG